MNITFEKAALKHQDIIFSWLAEPHMQEFWDNSQEHKNDIVSFMHDRKIPSPYFNGRFSYWVGSIDHHPFAFILSDEVLADENCPDLWRENLSKTGKTYCLDFGIGNPDFIGKGLAAATLNAFTTFFRQHIDPHADTFFIDPDINNPRAIHVYEQAGFNMTGEFTMTQGVFSGSRSFLMIKKL